MPQFDANDDEVEFVQCAVCEKAITGGKWFARIPYCTETFELNPKPYVRRIETYELMRSA